MFTKRPRPRSAVALVAVLAIVTAACGGDDAGDSGDANTDDATPAAEAAATDDTTDDGATDDDTAAGGTMAAEITEPVTITFENYNLAAAGANRDATLKMLELFEEANPLITVDAVATVDQEMFPTLQAKVVAGNPPDVAQLLLREWDQNIENLPVVPLDELAGPAAVEEHLQSGNPIHPRAAALTVRDGVNYGLAYVFSTPTLFYNADLFREVGLDPDDPPQTWDEVADAAQAIADGTDAEGLYVACIELDWCTQGILLSNGGRVMSPDRSEITWAGEESLEVYEFWQDIVESGAHADLSGADARDAFAAGNMGMYLQTSALQSSLIASSEGVWELRSTGMPSFGDQPPVPVNSGAGLGVFATDPVQQRAAWELVKFLTSEEAMEIITVEMGYLPLRPGMIDDPDSLGTWENRDLILPNLAQLDSLEPSLSFPGQNALQIRDLFLRSLELVLFNGADVTETFTDSQQRATELVG